MTPTEQIVGERGDERVLMTAPQENRMLAECRARRESLPAPAGFVPMAMEITAPICDSDVVRALQILIDRHESLRTGLIVDAHADSGHLTLAPAAEPRLVSQNCAAWPPEERYSLLGRHIDKLSEAPVDLDDPPLWRARLYRFSAGHCALAIVTDHLVMDGVSAGILCAELQDLLLNGGTLSAESGRPDYFDWARWQRAKLSGASREVLARYWRARLAGCGPYPDLSLPALATTVTQETHHSAALRLCSHQTAAVLAVAAAAGVTPFVLCLATVGSAWQQVAGVSDTVIHTPVANRSEPRFAAVVGWLEHTVPIRIVLRPHGSVREAMAAVRAATLEALIHQDMYLSDIAAEFPSTQPGGSRPPRLYFAFDHVNERAMAVQGGTMRLLHFPIRAADRARERARWQFDSMSTSGVSIYGDISEGRLGLGVVVDPRETSVTLVSRLMAALADAFGEMSQLGSCRWCAADA